MWDKLELRIPFKTDCCNRLEQLDSAGGAILHYDLERLPADIKLFATVTRFQESVFDPVSGDDIEEMQTLYDYRHPFDTLPSSFGGMAYRIVHYATVLKGVVKVQPHIMVKASPVKYLQGHNAWGWVDLETAYLNFMGVLVCRFPGLANELELQSAEVMQLDATHTVYLADQTQKPLLFEMLRNAQKGQTKLKNDYGSSLYFNGFQGGGVKQAVIYDKANEVDNDLKNEKRPELHDIKSDLLREHGQRIARGVRFEARINRRGLMRLGYPTKIMELITVEKTLSKLAIMPAKPNSNEIPHRPERRMCYLIWAYTFRDILESLQGQELNVMTDEAVYNQLIGHYGYWDDSGRHRLAKANRLYTWYLALRATGYDADRVVTDRTYRRNFTDLCNAGMSRSVLKAIKPGQPVKVVKFPILVNFDFREQEPEGYQNPANLPELQNLFAA